MTKLRAGPGKIWDWLLTVCTLRRHKPHVGCPDFPVAPPPRLPTDRIDIRQLSLEEQPPSCLFLRLPPELRQCIYELLLGGRVVHLKLGLIWPEGRRYVVRSELYEAVDDVADGPNELDFPTERISTALLLSCRQVYLEALPILHQHNTFYIRALDLEKIFFGALGPYCLPEIRSLYLYDIYHSDSSFDTPLWGAAFALLQQMCLDSLVFEFKRIKMWEHLQSPASVLDSVWGRRIVQLRNLRQFEVFFTGKGKPDPLMQTTNVAQRLQDLRNLMVGPGSEERYRLWLEDKGGDAAAHRTERLVSPANKGGL
ncbi:hypothetical protein DFH09DRAFT_1119244 [Mycena vulgaris]|nr:hypothetical protein DFH09DRAFT_1119244 [Mycena vulgaris]